MFKIFTPDGVFGTISSTTSSILVASRCDIGLTPNVVFGMLVTRGKIKTELFHFTAI